MATASRVKVGRNGHSRVGPDLIRHPFAGLVGGPSSVRGGKARLPVWPSSKRSVPGCSGSTERTATVVASTMPKCWVTLSLAT